MYYENKHKVVIFFLYNLEGELFVLEMFGREWETNMLKKSIQKTCHYF